VYGGAKRGGDEGPRVPGHPCPYSCGTSAQHLCRAVRGCRRQATTMTVWRYRPEVEGAVAPGRGRPGRPQGGGLRSRWITKLSSTADSRRRQVLDLHRRRRSRSTRLNSQKAARALRRGKQPATGAALSACGEPATRGGRCRHLWGAAAWMVEWAAAVAGLWC
jgi:predicted Fe-S protein YdhL (DUF1289 family)